MEEKDLSEQESLRLITDMIRKAKRSYHENGTSAILWGSVIAFCGLMSFARLRWKVDIGFDVWLLTLAAIIPQAIISVRQNRNRKVISHTENALNAVWIVYGISIFALVFYFNTVPAATDRILAEEGRLLYEGTGANAKEFKSFIPSSGSLLLLLYAIPTLATGLAQKFRPMIIAAILCYIFFMISCFVPTDLDMLLNGLAGIFNWLIPGLILRRRFLSRKKAENV
ncbi:MAG TPA: hypothetical protein VFR58_12955 [Flavisolibacter sp.]|nr:hypothetical protein [Flavisolibacter sp.]